MPLKRNTIRKFAYSYLLFLSSCHPFLLSPPAANRLAPSPNLCLLPSTIITTQALYLYFQNCFNMVMDVENSDPGDIIHMEGEPAPLQNEQPQPLRRSGRQPVKPKRLNSPDEAYESPSKKSTVSNTSPGRRRNPKRKVSQQCELVGHLPANLLEEALKPLDTNDIEEWEGWVELESDPVSSIVLYFPVFATSQKS